MVKILVINKLAPESLRGFLFFLYCFKYSGLRVTKLQLGDNSIQFVMCYLAAFLRFWGLTCDFWAVFEKNNFRKRKGVWIQLFGTFV
jgi:hypothetical protein